MSIAQVSSIESYEASSLPQFELVGQPTSQEKAASTIIDFTLATGRNSVRTFLQVPENTVDNVPLLWVNGLCAHGKAYDAPREAAVAAGRPAATMSPALHLNGLGDFNPGNYLRPETSLIDATCSVAERIASEMGVSQVDLAGHSWGGVVSIFSAKDYPEGIRSVLLLGSAGVDSRLSKLAKGFFGFAWHEVRPYFQEDHKIARAIEIYALGNPARRASEANRAARANVKSHLASLTMPTANIRFEQDHLFPPQNDSEDVPRLTNKYVVMKGVGHLAPQTHPEETVDCALGVVNSIVS